MSFKSFIKKVFSLIKTKIVITIIGITCLALLIWFGGPLIAIAGYEPLLSTTSRLVTLLVIAVGWAIYNLGNQHKVKKDNEDMVNSMIHGDESENNVNKDTAITKEVETLQQRMMQAHDVLRQAKLSKKNSIYQLPWYIMIGPPGAGKTTTIHNSGLQYPLMEKMGVDMIKGVGGTRNCDWWFTNKAVLIDTAGRYTTQDSHVNKDNRAWQGFLGLLKKYRPLRPINGVIISMGLSDLLNQTKTERNLHARAIKQRLQELQNQLGMTFPVYVLLSKCDLVVGFNEFFDDLEKEECEQIWGITFPLKLETEESIVSTFNKEFHGLLSNLNARLNTRLKNERDAERRRLIYEFPKQLRLLQNAADDFLKEIFSPNSYEVVPTLRGVYLTSATQEGLPIDKLSTGMLNCGRVPVQPAKGKSIRSYFIKHLLEGVIFPEKDLATTNKHFDKQNLLVHRGVWALGLLITSIFSYAWWMSYDWNAELVNNTEQSIGEYRAVTAGGLTKNSNIIELSKGLTVLRELPVGYINEPLDNEAKTWGLYQGDKLKQPAVNAYQEALNGYFLSYLSRVLIEEMDINSENLNYLYLTLKTYLMLYQPQHFVAEDIKAWFEVYFDRNVIGDVNEVIRQDLNLHLDTLLTMGVHTDNQDKNAIQTARDKLTMLTLVERAYQRLKTDYIPGHIPDFKLINLLGLDSLKVFSLYTDETSRQSIPGLYTYNGFHGIFNVEKNNIVKSLMEDSWVYGEEVDQLNAEKRKVIVKQLEDKYINDYIYYWEGLLDDLHLRAFSSDNQAASNIHLLAGADAPIQTIIQAVQKNVQLTKIPLSKNEQAAASVVESAADELLRHKKQRITRLLPDKSLDLEIDLPGAEVDKAFFDIINVKPEQLDKVQDVLRSIDHSIQKSTTASTNVNDFAEDQEGIDYLQLSRRLNAEGNDLSAPISTWFASISEWLDSKVFENKMIANAEVRKKLNTLWKTEVLRECQRAIMNKYPFNKRARSEVRLKDFSRFFGYGGTLDSFFDSQLKPYVNTNNKPWKFSANMGFNKQVLVMYKNAEKIKRDYFDSNMKKPHVEFDLKMLYLDEQISHFKLEVNSEELSYRHGPVRDNAFIWPGATSDNKTRIIFTPPNGGRSISQEYSGDWSVFRFLDDLVKQRKSTKKDGILDINVNGNNAKVLLTPSSINNPFWKNNLTRFSCPTKL